MTFLELLFGEWKTPIHDGCDWLYIESIIVRGENEVNTEGSKEAESRHNIKVGGGERDIHRKIYRKIFILRSLDPAVFKIKNSNTYIHNIFFFNMVWVYIT